MLIEGTLKNKQEVLSTCGPLFPKETDFTDLLQFLYQSTLLQRGWTLSLTILISLKYYSGQSIHANRIHFIKDENLQ